MDPTAFPSIGLTIIIWLLTWFVVCVICGICATCARDGGSGFWWGFLLGPFGVVVAAIKGVGDKIQTLTSQLRAAPAAAHGEGAAGQIRVRTKRPHAQAMAAPPATLVCPNCQTVLSADGLDLYAPITCPACAQAFTVSLS